MNVKLNPNEFCVTEQVSIELHEVAVEMIDLRTDEKVNMVFFVTVNDEPYGLEKKVDEICKYLGYKRISISSDRLEQTYNFDAGVVFCNLNAKQNK